jgi:hypothetical protein
LSPAHMKEVTWSGQDNSSVSGAGFSGHNH